VALLGEYPAVFSIKETPNRLEAALTWAAAL
jgi:hypothetical protein